MLLARMLKNAFLEQRCTHRLQDCSRWHLIAETKSGAGGGSRTLTGLLSPADFLTVYGLRRLEPFRLETRRPVCGLDYPFTIPR